jgi:hypothetical protein
VNTPSKSVIDVLRDAGFSRRGDNWLNRDLRKELSHEVVREYEKYLSSLRALIEELVPIGQFYFYRIDPPISGDAYKEILFRLDLPQLVAKVRIAAGKKKL